MQRGIILTIVLLVLSIATSAAGEDRREQIRRGPDRFEMLFTLPGLNLTAEQAQRIKVLKEAYRRDTQSCREQLRLRGRALRELWLSQNPDRERIMAIHAEVRVLRDRMNERLEARLQEVWSVLTPEQQRKGAAFKEGRRPFSPRRLPRRIPGGSPSVEKGMRGKEKGGQ